MPKYRFKMQKIDAGKLRGASRGGSHSSWQEERISDRLAVGQSSSQITRCVQTGHRGGVHRSQNRERRIPTQKLHLRLVEKPRRRVSSRGFVQDGSTGEKTETGAPSRTPSKPGRWEEGRLHGEEAQSRRMFRKQNLQDSRRSKNPALSFGLRGRTCHLGNKRRTMSSIWML